ncbi:unnamed protein product [Rhodiola kirilowii]
MSRHEDAVMEVGGRRCEVSPESYAYYMSRRGCSGYEMECERMGRSMSGSGSIVDERGECGWESSRGGSSHRVRSRSPRPYLEGERRGDVVGMERGHMRRSSPPPLESKVTAGECGSVVDERGEYGWDLIRGGSSGRVKSRSPWHYLKGSRKGDVVDMDISHRRRSSPPPLQSTERYDPAEEMISPSLKGYTYGYSTLEGGRGEYITFERNMKVVPDDIRVVQKSVEDKRMVRPHQGVQPASSYGERETSRHYLSGNTNRIADKRDMYRNHLSSERPLNLGAYDEDNLSLCSRDISYPVCSKSQANTCGHISPAYTDGDHMSSCCQGLPHMNSDDLRGRRLKVSEKSVIDAYEGHQLHNSTLDNKNHLKSIDDPIHRLNYHYPTVKEGEIGEIDYPYDGGYKDVNAGLLQTNRRRESGISGEANRFSSDEECGDLRQHARKDCYNAHLPLSISNETEDNYISDYSHRDSHLSHRVSHNRDMHLDPHSRTEDRLHGVILYDQKDPHFLTSSSYDPGCVASGTLVDNCHNHEEAINFRDSRTDLVCNAEDIYGDIPESKLRSYSVQNKQAGEQYYYATKIVSSSESRDMFAESGMYDPEISREIKQYDRYLDFQPPPEREHRDGRVRYNDSQRERINTKVGSTYDMNITSEHDMVASRLDTNKQRWVEEDPHFYGAPLGMLDMSSISSKRANMHTGSGTSHGRCTASSFRYLPVRNRILLEEGMHINAPDTTGPDCTRRKGSRSIFDRLGSPQGSIDQSPPRRMQGHFFSHEHEHRQIKVRTKSNHLTLNGSPHLKKGSSYCKQSRSSRTNTDEGHMKLAKDPDLEDLDIPVNPVSDNNTGDFKQSVQKAFLFISLKMNENPATRRRYQGQGKAGTLFCIVCKRSNSKEYRDARCLASHSLTCQKSGLRAQHLGLFKAICVTMGWNSDIDQDTAKWTPQVLPKVEALAQKEDLICWPPVFIVHTVSSLGKIHNAHKVLTTEELEAFFRSKGFITGRVKVCLGQSTNSQIMIVKFLGTFPGLKDAEKLHKYYAENKHGRAEFWKLAYTYTKGSQPCETTVSPCDNAESPDLYGYMGIAEDWDKLDSESKKRCTIKSKQEILDFSAEPIVSGGN